MRKILKFVKKILKLFYLLFPKIIRNQYSDSLQYYQQVIRDLFIREKHKVIIFENVNLISTPVASPKLKIISKVESRATSIAEVTLYLNNNSYKVLPEVRGNVPDLYLLECGDVKCIGWSLGLLIDDKSYYHPELYNQLYIYDNKVPSIHQFTNTSNQIEDLQLTVTNNYREFDNVIHLLKEHSTNYYHWLFEIMPRLIKVVDHLANNVEYQNQLFTILVNKGVVKNCIELLALVMPSKFNYKVEYIEKGELVKCKKLYYTSPLWYSFDNTKHFPNPEKDFLVDRVAVELVHKKLNEYCSNAKPTDKIYLARRKAQMRNIINQDEVEELMEKFGFRIVYTDVLSIDEQKSLFSNAKIVVGAAGATFSNMIFMCRGSKSIIFSPSVMMTNYYIFQQVANVSSVDLVHFITTPKKNTTNVHEDFYIDCKQLESYLLKEVEVVV